jgi:hypothetical protein
VRNLSKLWLLLAVAAASGCMNPVGTDEVVPAQQTGMNPTIAPATGTGTVTVVHGVPDLVVDVYVNGEITLPGFEPKTVTEPLELPEGDYDIEIVPAGGSYPDEAVITGSAFLPAGANASIVAHLAADGTPSLTTFVNDVSRISYVLSRVNVRHVAQAGAVDVRLFRRAFERWPVRTITDLSNPDEVQTAVLMGNFKATVAPARSKSPIFSTDYQYLKGGKSYIFYAIGNPANGSFDIITQVIDLPQRSWWRRNS